MQYQHAVRLGMLHKQLGIPANARIMLQIVTDGPFGAYIWDLESGKTYIVVQGGGNNPIVGQRDIPQHVKDIIAATVAGVLLKLLLNWPPHGPKHPEGYQYFPRKPLILISSEAGQIDYESTALPTELRRPSMDCNQFSSQPEFRESLVLAA